MGNAEGAEASRAERQKGLRTTHVLGFVTTATSSTGKGREIQCGARQQQQDLGRRQGKNSLTVDWCG